MYRPWYLTDENGVVRKVGVSPEEKSAPWHPMPEAMYARVYQAPRMFRADAEGELHQLPEIRLSISTPTFVADGVDCAEVLVFGEGLSGEVQLTINGRPETLEFGEVLELVSEVEGVFVIELADPRYYAREARRRTTALRKDESDE